MTVDDDGCFASQAAGYGVDLTRETAEGATTAPEGAVEAPAVGAPLGIDEASLPPG